MIAHNPLHGSGQAELPHPALALGNDAHTAQGMTSQILPVCPTSQVRSSSACVLRLPDASPSHCCSGRTWDLPVPARGVYARARGL